MKKSYDLGSLKWQLSGWAPHFWRFSGSMETGATALAEIPAIPASVPGSVQKSLLDAALLPDWNAGTNSSLCEWVENRHWLYETVLPDDWVQDILDNPGKHIRLKCLGLDYSGWVLVNGKDVASFQGSFVPHEFDIKSALADTNNRLVIAFDCPPRWLGQFGYTSQITEWKPRFNYFWDWTARLVQIGIWDNLYLEITDDNLLTDLRCTTGVSDGAASIKIRGTATGSESHSVSLILSDGDGETAAKKLSKEEIEQGFEWPALPVEIWQPNGIGTQPLYSLNIVLLDDSGNPLDHASLRIGFKSVRWTQCAEAPEGADPWVCVVNGAPLFLQGVNWTPIRPNFADVTEDDYRRLLTVYRDMGCNMLRVWGGAFLEKKCFYDLCDELGLLVWQEFPLSSSGIDNWPPEDPRSISDLAEIALSYIARRRHHVSLTVWCGGNELQGALDGGKQGGGLPVNNSHPLIERLGAVVEEFDPTRRFLPTSSSGPRFMGDEKDFGKGLHWDVHGPWAPSGEISGEWASYWSRDDALFRSETGAPGASPVDLIRAHLGGCSEMPATLDNPLWRRMAWWIESPQFVAETGREPVSLEEYVAWSQARQAAALEIAARSCKQRFPACGGILIWMGHDSFPCAANTSIVDFWGRPKPAGIALGRIFREAAGHKQVRTFASRSKFITLLPFNQGYK